MYDAEQIAARRVEPLDAVNDIPTRLFVPAGKQRARESPGMKIIAP